MSLQATPASDAWYRSVEKTSQTDDERIKDITVLPPPEHLIRFFPIGGTPVETLITQTRKNIHNIMLTCLCSCVGLKPVNITRTGLRLSLLLRLDLP